MRSLFLKIFLWFGLAMIVVNVASFATGILIERRSQGNRPNPMAPTFGIFSQTAVEVYERDGQFALANYLDRMKTASRIDGNLFNDQGQEVSGHAILPGAIAAANGAR